MDDEIRGALAGMAGRGRDPDPRSVWDAATAAAQRRRRTRRVRTTIAGATAIALVCAAGVVAFRDNGVRSPRVGAVAPTTTNSRAGLPNDAIAFTRNLTIWVTRSSTAPTARPLTVHGCCSVSAWSPDHKLIAVNEDNQVTILRSDGTRVRRLVASTVFAPSWSPDGRQIAFSESSTGGSNGGPIQVVDVAGQRSPRTVGDVFAGNVAWSPDGTRIAFTSLDEPRHIDILALATGKVTRLTDGPGGEQWAVSWSAANGRIVFASTDGVYEIGADGRGLRRVARVSMSCCPATSPSWSPDGTTIVFATENSATFQQQIIVVDVATRRQRVLISGPEAGTAPAW